MLTVRLSIPATMPRATRIVLKAPSQDGWLPALAQKAISVALGRPKLAQAAPRLVLSITKTANKDFKLWAQSAKANAQRALKMQAFKAVKRPHTRDKRQKLAARMMNKLSHPFATLNANKTLSDWALFALASAQLTRRRAWVSSVLMLARNAPTTLLKSTKRFKRQLCHS